MEEQFIPIDIHTNKLPEWLVSRRHCIRDWQPKVHLIREKINNAIQDMPVHEGITRLLSGTFINYFHCLKIVEILKETEADTKSFFGRYGSQRMKDWQEVVKLYEKDNAYLSEAAQLLCRSVLYEIPSLKKEISKCEKMQSECERRETDLKKEENSARKEFKNSCKKLGISGEKIGKELLERCKELPKMYAEIAQGLPSLSESAKFYRTFMLFMCGSNSQQECVPLLSFMIVNGNTTTYEWIHKEKPLRIEEPTLGIYVEDEDENKADVVDFGDGVDFGDLKLDSGEIDFGEDVHLETGDIDWGVGDGIQLEESTGKEEIDFNISLDETGIEVHDGGIEGGVASGSDALSLLDNPITRTDFINDLMEVESFLKMRLHEMKTVTNDILSLAQLQNADPLLQVQTTDSIQKMLSTVQNMITKMNDPVLFQLHNTRHSQQYVDNLVKALKHKLILVDKLIAEQGRVHQKGIEQGQEAEELYPKLKTLVSKTKELQHQIEEDISKKYKGRRVHLMGGATA